MKAMANHKVTAARKAVEDYRRNVLHNRATNPGTLARWVEILATELEEKEAANG